MKGELGGKIIKEFVGLRRKAYTYSKDNNDEDKNVKGTKKCVIKIKLKPQDYKNCLDAAQIENKIKLLKRNKIDVDSLKEFIKNNKLILKTQQRFKSERHNVLLKKLIRLLYVQMMIKECNQLIR